MVNKPGDVAPTGAIALRASSGVLWFGVNENGEHVQSTSWENLKAPRLRARPPSQADVLAGIRARRLQARAVPPRVLKVF